MTVITEIERVFPLSLNEPGVTKMYPQQHHTPFLHSPLSFSVTFLMCITFIQHFELDQFMTIRLTETAASRRRGR